MKKTFPSVLACLPLLLLAGCFDTKEEFTLNPDGSGKVTVESVCAPFQMDMTGEKKTPEQKLQAAIKNIFDNTKGVAAWRNVTYKQQDDGRIWFKGTAYFEDLNKVQFNGLAIMEFSLLKTNDGRLVLETQMKKEGQKKKTAAAKLSDAEMAAKIKEARANYQSSKPMLMGFLATLKQETVFHLPGAASQVSNFKTTSQGDLQINFSGTNMMAAMEALTASDDWWRQQVAASDNVVQDGPEMDDALNEKLFGQKAPVRAVIAAGAAKFDYATEVAAAQTEFAALQKQLGMASVVELAPPSQGGAFKSLKVGGVRWIFDSDDKNEVQPFGSPAGYTLAVVGELPGSVMEMSDGKVETALGSDGSNLLPEDEWDRKISSPRLSKDQSKVVFEVNLRPPGPGVKGFKEISGSLSYSVGEGSKDVNLGITEIKDGATGTALGASIESLKPGFGDDGSQDLELKLNLDPRDLISLTAIDAKGQKTVLQQNGYSGGNHQTTFTFAVKTALPANARLVAKVYAKVKNFEIPFKLSNLNLSGQPIH
jgi:hypothetical protein